MTIVGAAFLLAVAGLLPAVAVEAPLSGPGRAASAGPGDEFDLLQAEVVVKSAAAAKGRLQEEGDDSDASREQWVCPPKEEAAAEVLSEEPASPQAEAPEVPSQLSSSQDKSLTSSLLGQMLSVLSLVLVLDGARRWQQQGNPAGKGHKKVDNVASAGASGGWEELMKASLAGDRQRCEALLPTGAGDMARTDIWGCTLLHAAAKGGSVPVVRQFLERGAEVNRIEAWDETPLHLAAHAGRTEVCELLLEYGASIDAPNAQDSTPLVVAAEQGHEATCRMLLAKGAGAGGLDDSRLPTLLATLIAEQVLTEGGGPLSAAAAQEEAQRAALQQELAEALEHTLEEEDCHRNRAASRAAAAA